MRHTLWRAGFALTAALSLSVAVLASPQAKPDQTQPNVKRVTAQPIQSVEGKDNFEAYCAVCHGKSGKGDGPAAPAMKVPVADLTAIAKKNGGTFNAVQVAEMIKGANREMPSHGSKDMPIWGPVFRSFSADQNIATLRVNNLVDYLKSIQVQ
jgi:mono/diheme cytochrome c family protein